MSSLVFRITGDTSAFKSAMGEVSGALDGVSTKTASLGQNLESVGSRLALTISTPLALMAKNAITASAEMDSLRRALETTAGSAGAAEKQFVRLQEIAKLPAIGLEEAVRGSIRLQNYGLSAEMAEKALKGFSNAIGASGGSAEDTQEALRQLGQTFGRQKVTMDNLRIILERVPQAAKIIKQEFGAEALADPAKALEKLGVDSAKFVEVLINRLSEASKVTPSLKTEFENLGQEFKLTAAAIGDQLKPAVMDMIKVISSAMEMAKSAAVSFGNMPKPLQEVAIGMGAIAIAAPVVIAALGTVVSNFSVLMGAASGIAASVSGLAATIGTYGVATSAAVGAMAVAWAGAVAVGVYSIGQLTSAFYELYAASTKQTHAETDLSFATENLLKRVRQAHPEVGALELRYRSGAMSADDFSAELRKLAAGMESTTVQTPKAEAAIKKFGETTNKIIVTNIAALSSTAIASKSIDDLGQVMVQWSHGISGMADVIDRYSKHSLVGVEAQERLKSAIGKVKDVMFDYITAGTLLGKTLDTANTVVRSFITESGGIGSILVSNSKDFSDLARRSDDYAESLKRIIAEQENLVANDNVKKLGETPLGFPKLPSVWTAQDSMNELGIRSEATIRKEIQNAEARLAEITASNRGGGAGAATGNDVIKAQQKVRDLYREINGESQKSSKIQSQAMRQVSLVMTDLSRGITDAIFKGGKFGDVMKNIALDVSKSITRLLIEGAIKDLGKSLFGLQTTATGVFSGIAKMMGGLFSGAASGATQALGGAVNGAPLSGIFSNVTKTGVPGVTAVGMENPLGGLPGFSGGGGAAGAASKAVGSSISAVAGIVTGAASAISGIIGNFQMKGMNKTLDLIEKSTRYAEAYQLEILNKTNSFLPKLADIHDRLIEFRQLGIKLEAGGSFAMAGAVAGGDSYYFDFSGANLGNQTPQAFEAALTAAITKMKQKGLSK